MSGTPEIHTDRLLLRPGKMNDAEAIFSYRSDKEANQYQGWVPKSIEEAHEFINKLSAEFNVVDTWFQYVIIHQASKELIGDVGVHFIDEQQVEIGYSVAKEHQQMGYATEAVRSVIDYLFKELNKHRITASIDPENTASVHLLNRLGFRKEAHFKESYFLRGDWVDDVVYAILRKEWGKVSC